MPAERIAVVTGASSGIGAATTRQLASVGFHVV
ncbi:MAG TPA: oxidoreductase, partial [Actinomycetota bacterium]|nr:oxidoreductase [Actinomycetota bacterium]